MPVGKLQDAADIHLLEAIENGMVCVVFVAGVFQAPARFLELDIRVLAVSDPLVDCGNPVFKLVFKCGQMFFDWKFEDRAPDTFNQFLFIGAPGFFVDEIVFEASEPDAITAVDVACFEPVTQKTSGEKLIAVGNESLLSVRFADIKIPVVVAGDETDGNLVDRILPERLAFGEGGL